MALEVFSITYDCREPRQLAEFWAAVLGRDIPADGADDSMYLPGRPAFSFVQVPEAKTVKNRVHVDLKVADLGNEVDRIVGLGAKRLGEYCEGGYEWATLADPEGNEFDVGVEVSPS